ncbi:hypothetical protein KKF64_02765 [Patescibacteria group bacterium]|nr:hypothetical protein [Patescibacteria group bacterium]
MTKKEKAQAIAMHSAMQEAGISANMILKFATTPEVHGYYRGLFLASHRQSNPYILIRKIEERKKNGLRMNQRRQPTARSIHRTRLVIERHKNGQQLALF